MHRPILALVILALAACARPAPRGAGASADSLFVYGARVRFVERGGSADAWRAGLVGTAGKCLVVMEPSPPPPARPVQFRVVSVDSLAALRIAPRGADSTALADVSVDAVRRRHGGCSPL